MQSVGVIFDDILKFCVSISVLAMTSFVAYVFKRSFTTSFQNANMPFGLSADFQFARYRRDANEAAGTLVLKCFTHYMAAPSWIAFRSHACLGVARKSRIEIGSLDSNMFVLICS